MPRWYGSRPWWLYWTVAGRGARDGLINHPKEAQFQEMRPRKGQLDAVAGLLQEIEARLPPGTTDRPSTAVADGDYDAALRAFGHIMLARGFPIEALPPDARCEIIRVMTELAGRQWRSSTEQPGPLTHYQAELVAIAEGKIERLCRRWETRRNGLEAEADRVQPLWVAAHREYAALEREHGAKGHRQPHPLLPMWLYLSFLLGLGVAEYWMNLLAFELWFQKGSAELIFAALLPSFVIPFFAHGIGTQVRHWQGQARLGERISRISIVVLLITSLVALLLLPALGSLRVMYVAMSEDRSFDWLQFGAVLAMNLAGLAAGVFAAYFAHEGDAELVNICRRKRRLWRRLHRIWRHWVRIAGEFDTLRGKCIRDIGIVRQDTIASLLEYRDYGIRYRADGAPPSLFRNEIQEQYFKPRFFPNELAQAPPPIEELPEFASGRYRRLWPVSSASGPLALTEGPAGAPPAPGLVGADIAALSHAADG